MAPRKSKSLFRAPDAQHFQLVHRSQRDPLIHDPDAAQRVLKPVTRINDSRRGLTLAELEGAVGRSGSGASKDAIRKNEGEAAEHGIFYDDTRYDYMQHLRTVGDRQSGIDSFMVSVPKRGAGAGTVHSAPTARGNRRGGGGEDDDDLKSMFRGGALPAEAMASTNEISREEAWGQQSAVPTELKGLQPDMDPHLRQVLEALDDDAFVVRKNASKGKGKAEVVIEEEVEEEIMKSAEAGDEEEDDEDWLNELIGGGERQSGYVEPEWEFQEWGIDEKSGKPRAPDPNAYADDDDHEYDDEDYDDARTETGEQPQTWEEQYKAFKQSGASSALKQDAASVLGDNDEDEDDFGDSEMGDTVGSLPAMSVIGGKKRRRKAGGGSDASGYSMSSSSMFRNKGLSTLDEMFDKVEQDYENDEDDEDWDDDENMSELMSEASFDDTASNATFAKAMRSQLLAHGDGPPEISREDFDGIMDDFLENYEVVGNRMVGKLQGETGADKFGTIRRALLEGDAPGDDDDQSSMIGGSRQAETDYIRKRFLRDDIPDADDGALPAFVHAPANNKDKWDVETILSTYSNMENHPKQIGVQHGKGKKPTVKPAPPIDESSETESDGDLTETEETARKTIARAKGESKDDKKARKAAVKADRANRRAEKKDRQELFNGERRKQIMQHSRLVGNGGAADITALAQMKMGALSFNL